MKDLGVADVILEIKITRTLDGTSLSQSHYVNKMIERFKEHGRKEFRAWDKRKYKFFSPTHPPS